MEKKQALTRLVKMKFTEEHIPAFITLFEENREKIAAFAGCEFVGLHRDLADQNTFFTISKWRSENDLENYRKSELFASVWAKTKILFAGKPEAWSLIGN
jgi:quinol monooxygenase YgiN